VGRLDSRIYQALHDSASGRNFRSSDYWSYFSPWAKIIKPILVLSVSTYRKHIVDQILKRLSYYENLSSDENKILRLMVARGVASLLFLIIAATLLMLSTVLALPEAAQSNILSWPFPAGTFVLPSMVVSVFLIVISLRCSFNSFRSMIEMADLAKAQVRLRQTLDRLQKVPFREAAAPRATSE
jgi:hypothetical protein